MSKRMCAAGLLAAAAVLGVAAISLATAGQAAGGQRFITMIAVEPKGGTTVDKEPFPTAALPEGAGYNLKKPDATGRWEVSTYRWEPSQIVVQQGDEVTLEIIGINGAEHPSTIEGYDIPFAVKRGQVTRMTFTADKAGVFTIRCSAHPPAMVADLIVLPRP